MNLEFFEMTISLDVRCTIIIDNLKVVYYDKNYLAIKLVKFLDAMM